MRAGACFSLCVVASLAVNTSQELLNQRTKNLDTLIYSFFVRRVPVDIATVVRRFTGTPQEGALVTNESILDVKAIGVFEGGDDIFEYAVLASHQFNRGAMEILDRTYNASDVHWLNSTTAEVTVHDVYDLNHIDRFEAPVYFKATYFQNSALFKYVYTQAPQEVRISATQLTLGADELCENAVFVCHTGLLYPYASVDECKKFLRTRPMQCTEPDKEIFGDTLLCRTRHLASGMANPIVHCPHLNATSVKCRLSQCPSAVPIVPNTKSGHEDEDVTDINIFVLILVGVAFSTSILAPATSYIVYLTKRRRTIREFDLVIRNSSPTASLSKLSELELPVPGLSISKYRLSRSSNNSTIVEAKTINTGGNKLIAVLGPSGCGKTTMMKAMSGLIGGYAIQEADDVNLQNANHGVMYCAQDSVLFPPYMYVIDLVLFHAQLCKIPPGTYAHIMKVLDVCHLVQHRYATLSGGEKKRVDIALAIGRPGRICFMDEPLAAIGGKSSATVLQLFRAIPGVTFIASVHKPSVEMLQSFDEMWLLEGGRVKQKSVAELRRSLTRANTEKLSKLQGFEAEHVSTSSSTDSHPLGMIQEMLASTVIEFTDSVGEAAWTMTRSLQGKDKVTEVLLNVSRPSVISSIPALFGLWHAGFFILPVIEGGACFMSALAGVLIGSIGDPLLSGSSLARKSLGVTYSCLSALAASFIQVFECANVYAVYEKDLIDFYIQMRWIPKRAVATANLCRFMFLSILISAVFFAVFLPMTPAFPGKLFPHYWIVFMTTVVYITAIGYLSFYVSNVVDKSVSIHACLLIFCIMLFLCGMVSIPFGELPDHLQTLHLLFPPIHLTACVVRVLYQDYAMTCEPFDHPSICSDGKHILSLLDLPHATPLTSMGVSCIYIGGTFLLLSMGPTFQILARKCRQSFQAWNRTGAASENNQYQATSSEDEDAKRTQKNGSGCQGVVYGEEDCDSKDVMFAKEDCEI